MLYRLTLFKVFVQFYYARGQTQMVTECYYVATSLRFNAPATRSTVSPLGIHCAGYPQLRPKQVSTHHESLSLMLIMLLQHYHAHLRALQVTLERSTFGFKKCRPPSRSVSPRARSPGSIPCYPPSSRQWSGATHHTASFPRTYHHCKIT